MNPSPSRIERAALIVLWILALILVEACGLWLIPFPADRW